MASISKNTMPLLVVCGPSGAGKSTLLQMLFEKFPDKFGFSVSHTTRKPREGEKDGKDYHFTTTEKMQEEINKGLFLETATFSGNMYGTSLSSVENVRQTGKICVLDIETEGVKQVKQKNNLDLILVFVKPPSTDSLENRLRNRGTETEESLNRRLSVALSEIKYGETEGNFDIVITNENLDSSYSQFENFITNELKKREIPVLKG